MREKIETLLEALPYIKAFAGATFVIKYGGAGIELGPNITDANRRKEMMAVLKDQNAAPVLLYCSSSNRVGAVLAVVEYRRGRSRDDALAEGRKAGLKSPAMEKAALRVMD